MDVVFLLKGDLEGLPPMLPRLLCLAERGLKMQMICTRMTEENRQRLTAAGIAVYETRHNTRFLRRENRLLDWRNFRASVKKLLKTNTCDYLYICSADTALCLGSLVFSRPFVLQSNELYDQLTMYRKGLTKYMQRAVAVVVPEYCRANICACWYGLKRLPYVIPNMPYLRSLDREQIIDDPDAARTVMSLKGKKILIYQGHINSNDRSMNVIAKALSEINNSNYALVLMGHDHDGSVQKMREIYPDTYYIPFIKAPAHLQVTSHAHIGILSYDRISMNNAFCAPNKIFEYSAYGIPMLGNNIPGLKYCIEHEKMGCCADYEEVQSVAAAIRQLCTEHETYSDNALRFFRSIRLDAMIEEIFCDI